jgi:hypothetical protein
MGGGGRNNPDDRPIYLLGLRDGLNLTLSNPAYFPGAESSVEAYRVKKFTTEDFMVEITSVYANRENIRIPVAAVYNFVNTKLKGNMSQSEAEQALKYLRQVAAEY